MLPCGVNLNTNTNYTGADITTTAVEDGTGFPFTVIAAPWSHTPGTLPILNGLAGQDDTLPPHLR